MVLQYRGTGEQHQSPVFRTSKMFTSTVIFVLIVVTFPIVFLLWLTESKEQKVLRIYKSEKISQQKLADRLNVSRYFVRKTLAAAM